LFEIYKTQLEKSYIGRKLWKLDQHNLKEAIEEFNPYDQRQKLLKQWYRKKEQENSEKSRAPTGQFNKLDRQLR